MVSTVIRYNRTGVGGTSICQPDSMKVINGHTYKCDMGTIWLPFDGYCGPSGICPPPNEACTPGLERCVGGILSRCSDDGTAWSPVGTCSILDTPSPGATHYVQIIKNGVILYNSWCSLTKQQVSKLLTLANQTGFGGGGGGGRK